MRASEPFADLKPPSGVTGDVVRGKEAFERRGCLACHQHVDFPAAKESQGPEPSRRGSKLVGANGKQGRAAG